MPSSTALVLVLVARLAQSELVGVVLALIGSIPACSGCSIASLAFSLAAWKFPF